MTLDITSLPEAARALIAAQAATIAQQQAVLTERQWQIARLQAQLAKLRRMHFGRSSERLGTAITQLELALGDLEEQEASSAPVAPAPVEPAGEAKARKPARRPLPGHLPRDVVTHPSTCACPHCGGELHRLGEDVTEVLDYRPASFRVIRRVRAKFSCRACEAITQAPAPSLPIRLTAYVASTRFAA